MKATVIFVFAVVAACLNAHTDGWVIAPSVCSTTECQQGTCVQVGSTAMRTCPAMVYYHFLSEFRNKRLTSPLDDRRLYRVLREDEDPRNGITAKNPHATKSIQSHVGCGSRPNYESQYISCTTNYQAALDYGRLVIGGRGQQVGTVTIAVIDRDALERGGHTVHDLSNAGPDVLPGVMARNFARRYDEALVERYIPAANIVDVKHILLNGKTRC